MVTASPDRTNLLYAADENPPPWVSLILSAQHVLLMFTGIIMVPVIMAKSFDLSPEEVNYLVFASIMVTSVTTLIQTVRVGKVGAGYVLFMGTSGTYLACTLDAMAIGGLALVATLCLLSAPVEFLFAYFLRFFRKIVTLAVGGVVVMLVTVSVAPIGLEMWTGTPGTPEFGSVENLLTGLATFVPILFIAVLGRPRIRLWAPIIGTAIGYTVGWHAGLVDLSRFHSASVIGLPDLAWPGIQFQLSPEMIPLLITFCFVTLVGTIESVGDAMAVQRVSERRLKKIDYDRVQGCLYADGVGNALAGLSGTVPNTTYSGNIAVLQLTGVASRRIGIYGAAILGVLAFLPKVSAVMISIPGPVLGAALVFLLGMLFATGAQLAVSGGMNYQTGIVVGVSFGVGLMMESGRFFTDIVPASLAPILNNGLVMGGLAAIVISAGFQIVSGRKAVLNLDPDPAQVRVLQEFIQDLATPFRMTDSHVYALQLACEEVFTHICRNPVDGGNADQVRFQWVREEEHIQVEVEHRSKVSDVDEPIPPGEPEHATDEELEQLGLFLLHKVASDVSHIRISGYNCISFKIH